MKKLISALTVFVFVFAMCLTANAQLANTYTFSTGTGAVLEDMTGSTALAFTDRDDGASPLTSFPGGFAFIYEGVSYTQFSVTPDGFLKLGSPVTGSQFTNSITDNTNRPKMMPYWDDMALGSVAGGGNVSYKIFGVAPNRKLVVQWFVTIPRNTTGAANSTFQLWLNESSCGSGLINFVYGTMNAGAMSSSVAINSTSANASNFVSVTISSNTASIVTANNTNAGQPASGRQYNFTPPAPANEVGITASNLTTLTLAAGKCYSFRAVVTNFSCNILSGVPVVYTVDGGADVGPVLSGNVPVNGNDTVVFSGINEICNLTPGAHTIAIRTLAGPPVTNRAPLSVNINVLSKITVFPYVEKFTNPVGWTLQQSVALWGLVTGATFCNPDGKLGDTAIRANNFSIAEGNVGSLRSPIFDFTNLSHPVLHFYVAYRVDNFQRTRNDSLQVLVSTNDGATFSDFVPTPYQKSRRSVPALPTLPSSSSSYTPTVATGGVNQWRLETIDMAGYAGQSNVMISFRETSDFGNNCWIDNVVVTNSDSYCENTVTATGPYTCNANMTSINFVTLTTLGQDPNALDNVNGGTLSVTQHDNQTPPSVAPAPTIAPNVTATTSDNSIYTPDFIGTDNWWTMSYNGDDSTAFSQYQITIDANLYGSISGVNLDKAYIMRRTDMTGKWVCLNTSNAGGFLTAQLTGTPLTLFGDFCLAGEQSVFPVELASFTSVISGRDVTLSWTTNTEENNAGFDIERKLISTENWSKVTNITGNGNSSTPINYTFTDRGLNSGKYNYRLKQIDLNGNFEYFALSNEVNVGIPEKFALSQNYPNPFNPTTNINYDIPFDGKVNLTVFDMSGKEVATLVNEAKTAGYYTLNFNGANLSSGVYFYRITADANGQNFVTTKKMTLVK